MQNSVRSTSLPDTIMGFGLAASLTLMILSMVFGAEGAASGKLFLCGFAISAVAAAIASIVEYRQQRATERAGSTSSTLVLTGSIEDIRAHLKAEEDAKNQPPAAKVYYQNGKAYVDDWEAVKPRPRIIRNADAAAA